MQPSSRASVALLILAAAAGGACNNDVAPVTDLTLSSGTLIPPFSPDVYDYTATSMTSLVPIGVTVTAPDASELSVNGQAATSGATAMVKLAPLEDITVTADFLTYTVHYDSPSLPAISVTTSAQAGDEPILLTPGNAMLEIVDRAGRPLYYRNDGDLYIDFDQQVTSDLGTVYTYLSASRGSRQVFASLEGTRHILDASFREIETAPVLANAGHDELVDDAHDFLIQSRDHYIAMSYDEQVVDLRPLDPKWSAHALVVENVVQEVNHGAVTLEWHNTDDPELFFDSVDGDQFNTGINTIALADYTHLNSLDIDPANQNLIMSLRHADEVIELDRTTGQKLWTLGGLGDEFGLSAAQKFSHQHYVKRQADGTILLFDNGNNVHQTRVLQIGIDEAAKKVTSYAEVYVKPKDQAQTLFEGSVVQPGPGRYVIGWGGGVFKPGALAVSEVIGGNEVWTLRFDDPSIQSYRALPMLAP